LSINRFERKKNIDLAIEAFAEFKKKVNPSKRYECQIIIAG